MTLNPYLKAWWRLSRIPFLSVGILPLILGFVLAWKGGYRGAYPLCLLALIAVVLILWMTYYLGEWNDLQGDCLNHQRNRFSGGSRVLVEGILPVWVPLFLGYICLVTAIVIGLTLFLHHRTGPWTLPLGAVGILCGFFYSNKPFRWSYRGIGEILIGVCYGWLPIATGFYLFSGFFSQQVLLVSIPIGLSVFNVILINEFPDEAADRAVGKKNLVVRFGKEKMADLYLGLSILTGLSFLKVMSILQPKPHGLFVLSGIPILLIGWNCVEIWRGNYRDPRRLETLSRNGLFVNLSITLILTIQQTGIGFAVGR
jgi:1,4-dihydroxy-2-naphthoate octaprenyltransferase